MIATRPGRCQEESCSEAPFSGLFCQPDADKRGNTGIWTLSGPRGPEFERVSARPDQTAASLRSQAVPVAVKLDWCTLPEEGIEKARIGSGPLRSQRPDPMRSAFSWLWGEDAAGSRFNAPAVSGKARVQHALPPPADGDRLTPQAEFTQSLTSVRSGHNRRPVRAGDPGTRRDRLAARTGKLQTCSKTEKNPSVATG